MLFSSWFVGVKSAPAAKSCRSCHWRSIRKPPLHPGTPLVGVLPHNETLRQGGILRHGSLRLEGILPRGSPLVVAPLPHESRRRESCPQWFRRGLVFRFDCLLCFFS